MHAAIFNIITLMATVSMMGYQKSLGPLSYISVDDATAPWVQAPLFKKIDITSAFLLLPLHPADRHLLAMEWKGSIFFDNCLPFGLRSAHVSSRC